jgi:hypothetical protein
MERRKMKVALALALFLALASPAVVKDPVVVAPTIQTLLAGLPAYDTLEEAGVHAIARAYKCSHVYECGGAIAQRPDGKFVVGPVYSSYEGDSLEIHHRVPPDWTLVADFHTHPCLPQHHDVPYFSPPDLISAISSHVIAFMGDTCTGNVHMFVPGKDAPDNEQPPNDPGVYLTQGRIVGHITVDGIDVEPNTGM